MHGLDGRFSSVSSCSENVANGKVIPLNGQQNNKTNEKSDSENSGHATQKCSLVKLVQ